MRLFQFFILVTTAYYTFGQDTEDIFRVNFINPSIEYEVSLGNSSVISMGLGIGYSGSYRELEVGSNNGFLYIIAPFFDAQYKYIYNRAKRAVAAKSLDNNAGNFFSLRVISKGQSIAENVTRTDDFDFAIGPTWGIQRQIGKLHFLFDVGPQFYLDTKGNNGIFPLMMQLNLGLPL